MINLHCGSRINPKEKAFWANFCKMMSVFNSYFRHNFSFFLSFLFLFCWVAIRKDFVKDESSQKTRNCVTHPAGILLDWKKDFRGSKNLVLDNVCEMKIKKPSGLLTWLLFLSYYYMQFLIDITSISTILKINQCSRLGTENPKIAQKMMY